MVKESAFSLKSETRQVYPLLLLLSNIVLEGLLIAVRQEKQIKGIQIEKKEAKSSIDNVYMKSKVMSRNVARPNKYLQQCHWI